jgi:hypothetical protein
MGHESRIELWSPNLTTFSFVGFGTDRLRREEAMKTAGRENPNRWATMASNRAPAAGDQNRSCSIQWAEKQEKSQPVEMCFFLTSTFIELIRTQPQSPYPINLPGELADNSLDIKNSNRLGMLLFRTVCTWF